MLASPTLFNTFVKDLDDGFESTLTKFVVDAKMGSEVDLLEGRAILQRDLDKLEERASKKCMKFDKDKCKVLHLGRNNQKPQYWLGSVLLSSSLAKRNLGILVDSMLSYEGKMDLMLHLQEHY